ncbi:LmeA family phospholipid-binding protein [Streptomyces zingiberis]|uniref:DUF2993 domain-containing protein n=1 Tax=Streptomyces zingiberis TaxID=2053010 RepID=A0ABX1BQQ0_9ACTN|nr:DUF2993 domain-containing protein [Streptomyces zingiberis]NJQ00060.1 DUF2993 domain-containing protein [Streptomyces zingiberis]
MRALRILLILAVVLGGLFVAADRLAVNLAEGEAAKKIKSSQALSGDPEVSIQGFPFLTQAATQKLDDVRVTMDGMRVEANGQSVRLTTMRAQLRDVALENNFSSATAAAASGTATISYDDLSKLAEEGITVGYGGKDDSGKPQVKVTAGIQLPTGQAFERSVVSTVSVTGGDTIRLRAEEIATDGLPGVEDLVRSRIDMERKIAGLPKGLELESVKPAAKGIEITFTGRQVALAG